MLEQIFRSSTSVCFEIQSDKPYYSDKEYDILLDGKFVRKCSTNVFSLFDLQPNTQYRVAISLFEGETVFQTKSETACLSVKDFGAVGDGKTDDTNAVQIALNVTPVGGRTYFPKGVYRIRPITVKGDITVDLSSGAVLLGSRAEEDYPVVCAEVSDLVSGNAVECASWEGSPINSHLSLLNLNYADNVSIVGTGCIDGDAQNSTWWLNFKQREIGRPRLLFANKCRNLTIHGITVRNSASWTLHPFFCKDFALLDARVNAPKDSPNTDGCNPESCDGARIIGSVFSVGDDCVAIKSGKRYMGQKFRTPANRHLIRNCLMQFGHGAIVLGSEMAGGITNLTVEKCYFYRTDRGLRIKTRRGRGKDAIIDGVVFDNIVMKEVLTPLVINMFYFCDPDGKTEYVWSKKKLPVDDGTPYLGSFTFKNMVCDDCQYCAGYFYGLPEQPIGKVEIDNVKFAFQQNSGSGMPAMMSFIDPVSKQGLYFNNVKQVTLNNVSIEGNVGDQVTAVEVGSITRS